MTCVSSQHHIRFLCLFFLSLLNDRRILLQREHGDTSHSSNVMFKFLASRVELVFPVAVIG